MKIDIMTLFPEMCEAVLSESIIGRARAAKKVEVNCINIRTFAKNKHNKVDDTSYGGGMGRLREVCGAVSGMAFLASFISPCPTKDNAEAKKANYALVQEFAEAFRKQNGAIVCRTLLGLDRPKDEPTPSARTAEYYKKRPCADLVYDAALIVGNYLQNKQ